MGFLMVGFGGALGAMLRYGISLIPSKSVFPFLTLITNILGAFIIGVIVGTAQSKNISEKGILFLKAGFCGGFTTFSTFSLEAYNLIKGGNAFLGVLYSLISVIFCVVGVFLGEFISKKLLAK